MSRYLPFVIGAVLLIGLTVWEAQLSDRFSTASVAAEVYGQRFAAVPENFGEWQGTDLELVERERQVAGAVGYVSREYRNSNTGERVNLWLIVGHSRNICRHTPDVCYASSGFRPQSSKNSAHTMEFAGLERADFWTNSFLKEDATERALIRVFWAWYQPEQSGPMKWEAPERPRFRFGNSDNLCKMYFTSPMASATQTADQSPCIRFAQEFMPQLEKALMADPASTATVTAASDAT